MYSGPVRTCVACRTRRAQSELIRITVGDDGSAGIEGRHHRAAGRSAYVCVESSCAERAVASGALRRALKREVIDSSELRHELQVLIEERSERSERSKEGSCSGKAQGP